MCNISSVVLIVLLSVPSAYKGHKANTLGCLVTPLHFPPWCSWLQANFVGVWLHVVYSPSIKERASVFPYNSVAQYSTLLGSGS